MKIELKIPSMGESITQVTIGAIFKPSGSEVKLDEELMEFETDKLTQVLYAPEAGQVSYSVKTGDVLAVGQTFGFITVGLVDVKKEETLPAAKEEIVELKEEAPVVIETVAAQDTRPETRKRLSSLRKTLAERLVEAQKASLPLTTFNEVDMTQVMACREKYKEFFLTKHGVKLGLMSFFVKAVVSALQAFPVLNSYLDGDDLVYRNYFDIGVAVSTEKGVIVPVLKNSDVLSFADIEKQIADSAVRAKSGKLSLEELQGGGFTITNGGVFGSLLSTPMINPPQCAILGMHKITKRAVVVDDQIVIRPMMYLALSYDHRLLDGKEAVSFLIHVKNCIEDPLRLELGV